MLSPKMPSDVKKSNVNNNKNISTNLIISDNNSNQTPPHKRSIASDIKRTLYDYGTHSTIHGISYFCQNLPLKEKFFWICVFLFSIYYCFNLVSNIYTKWNETPVIVSFSEKSTPIWNIPFPAVTVCSETKRKILKEKGLTTYSKFYERLTESIEKHELFSTENITDSELAEYVTLLHICNTQIIGEGLPLVVKEPLQHYDILDKMVPDFERYFSVCRWFNFMGDCKELVVKTYTEEGICYTFNGLSPKDLYRNDTYQYQRMSDQFDKFHYSIITNRTLTWSLESGYQDKSGIKTYPARVLGAGARAGLFMALQSFIHEKDYSCRGPVQGFKVSLHSPNDFPQVSKQFVRVPMGKEILIAVKPNMITTSKGIASYQPHRRQCYMESERYLKFFKAYTQNNCELECLANFTLAKCGCVKFSMPRTLDMPVCNETNIYCYDKAQDELLLLEFTQGLKESATNYRGRTDCDCMPACTSLVYNAEISQGSFDLQELLDSAGDTEYMMNNKGAEMSRLSIYFKENQFITSKRSELYGLTDFLANCGGIFGLFVGFSFLSVAEIIYYFTLRMWSNITS